MITGVGTFPDIVSRIDEKPVDISDLRGDFPFVRVHNLPPHYCDQNGDTKISDNERTGRRNIWTDDGRLLAITCVPGGIAVQRQWNRDNREILGF